MDLNKVLFWVFLLGGIFLMHLGLATNFDIFSDTFVVGGVICLFVSHELRYHVRKR